MEGQISTKLLVYSISMLFTSIMIFVLLKGIFRYNNLEKKKCKWNNAKRVLPKKRKDETDSRRVMVSLSNGTVMFCEYYFEDKSFDAFGVEAWREVPPSYIDYKKKIGKVMKKILGAE